MHYESWERIDYTAYLLGYRMLAKVKLIASYIHSPCIMRVKEVKEVKGHEDDERPGRSAGVWSLCSPTVQDEMGQDIGNAQRVVSQY